MTMSKSEEMRLLMALVILAEFGEKQGGPLVAEAEERDKSFEKACQPSDGRHRFGTRSALLCGLELRRMDEHALPVAAWTWFMLPQLL